VVCLDNLITGDMDNVAHLFVNPRFSFVHQDVTNYIYVSGHIDAILHFASPASPIDYLELPIQTLKVGSLGTHKGLGLARVKAARFLLASTSEVYGDPLVHPQSESYAGNVDPVGPRGVYDEAKRYAEALVMAYHRQHQMDTRIVRIFNTYGPRMRLDDGRVVPNFIGQAVRGEALTVYGDGSQTRSFQYIDDLVEAVVRLLRSDYVEPVNIGTTREISIVDFAKIVNRVAANRAGIIYADGSRIDGDPQTRRPDTSRAHEVLNWRPKVELEHGLEWTFDYFRSVLSPAV